MRSLAAATSFSADAHMDVNDTTAWIDSGSFANSGYAIEDIRRRVTTALAAIGRVNGVVTAEWTRNIVADDVVAIGFSMAPTADTDTFRVGNAILAAALDSPHRPGFRLTTHKPWAWSIAGDVVDDATVQVGSNVPAAPTSSAGGLGILTNALATTHSTDVNRDTNTPLGNAIREVAKGENPLSLSTSVKIGALVVGSFVCLALVGYAVRSFK